MSVFNNKVEENGLKYYIIGENVGLFKATTDYDKKSGALILRPGRFYFFGIKDMSPAYIKAYEKQYGIIFEFVTTRQYKLLALDDSETRQKLYEDVPKNIKQILRNNYGYSSGKRNSFNEPDGQLSEYLCSLGFEGYAIHNMATDFGGTFNSELMICNIDGIQYIGKVTDDENIDKILEKAKLDRFGKDMAESRKKMKPASVFTGVSNNLDFGDDDDEEQDNGVKNMSSISRSLFGGKKRRTKKVKKSRRSKKRGHKRNTHKKRK
jgi:hypothetical protein